MHKKVKNTLSWVKDTKTSEHPQWIENIKISLSESEVAKETPL